MKLLTEMTDRMNGNGKHPVYNSAGIRSERAFARDVSAAHALMQAVGELMEIWNDHTDVAPSEIITRADEIMREWGMDVSE